MHVVSDWTWCQVNGSDTELFVIDEVGKMELFSSTFFPGVWAIFNSNVPVLSAVPIPKYGRDIPEGGVTCSMGYA